MELEEARQQLFETMLQGDGIDCPCCDQRAQIYKRGINGQMAYGLALLYQYERQCPGQYVQISHYFTERKAVTGNDGSLLRHWYLIEPREGTWANGGDGKDRTGGFYRISELGIAFIMEGITVPKFVYTYNEEVLGVSDESPPFGASKWVTFSDCVGTRFDLSEVFGFAEEEDVDE